MESRVKHASSDQLSQVTNRIEATQQKLLEARRRQALRKGPAGPKVPTSGRAGKPGKRSPSRGKQPQALPPATISGVAGGKLEKKLLHAIGADDWAEAQRLLEASANPDYANAAGQTPLHLAVLGSSTEGIELLLAHRVRLDPKDKKEQTPLHLAAAAGDFERSRALARAGASANLPNALGQTALHATVKAGSIETLAVLLKDGSPALDLRDHRGLTSLMIAAVLGLEDHLTMLIRRGADPSIPDADGLPLLHVAARNAHIGCISAIVKHVPVLLAAVDAHGRTATHLAASDGPPMILDVLLSADGVEIDNLDKSGRTPLHWAVVSNMKDCVELLLSQNANPTIRDAHGGVPLHYAMQQGHTEVIALLATNPASVNIADDTGRAPLIWGVIHNQHDCCKAIIGAGCDVNTKDKQKFTSLHYAAHAGRPRICQLLINSGAVLDAIDKNGHSPLFRAVIEGHMSCAEVLLSTGVREDLIDNEGRTCLHWAAHAGQPLIVKALLEAGCPYDTADENGMHALHEAASQGHTESVAILLKAGAALDVADLSGAVALHWAALDGHTETCRQLLAAGADIDAVDDGDPAQTAFHFALHGGHTACAAFLGKALKTKLGDKFDESVVPVVVEGPLPPNDAGTQPTTGTLPPIVGPSKREGRSPDSGTELPVAIQQRSPEQPTRSSPEKRREDGWDNTFIFGGSYIDRKPERPAAGNRRTPVKVNYDAGYPGLTGPLLSSRGGESGRERRLQAMLEHREREIRYIKLKNRELSESLQQSEGSAKLELEPLANIEVKCAELRATLDAGKAILAGDKSDIDPNVAKARRKAFKKEVKAALEEVTKLKFDTETFVESITGLSPALQHGGDEPGSAGGT